MMITNNHTGQSPPWAKSSSCKGQERAQRSKQKIIFLINIFPSITRLSWTINHSFQVRLAVSQKPPLQPAACRICRCQSRRYFILMKSLLYWHRVFPETLFRIFFVFLHFVICFEMDQISGWLIFHLCISEVFPEHTRVKKPSSWRTLWQGSFVSHTMQCCDAVFWAFSAVLCRELSVTCVDIGRVSASKLSFIAFRQ